MAAARTSSLPRASAGDTAGVVADVLVPLVARGVIARRRRVVGALDRLDADRRALRRLQRLRRAHGEGPVLLRIPGRQLALVLAPDHVHRVLRGSPEPFAPASLEKRAALERFQPHGVLVSRGEERADRRRFNEAVLDTSRPVHRLGGAITAKVAQEADALLAESRRAGTLDWERFAPAWWRMVRRVVLGDSAREDQAVTEMVARLRAEANWAYLWPRRRGLRDEFLGRLGEYVKRAEPGSLASLVSSTPSTARTFPVEQMPQWLFAFDAAGWRAFARSRC